MGTTQPCRQTTRTVARAAGLNRALRVELRKPGEAWQRRREEVEAAVPASWTQLAIGKVRRSFAAFPVVTRRVPLHPLRVRHL